MSKACRRLVLPSAKRPARHVAATLAPYHTSAQAKRTPGAFGWILIRYADVALVPFGMGSCGAWDVPVGCSSRVHRFSAAEPIAGEERQHENQRCQDEAGQHFAPSRASHLKC